MRRGRKKKDKKEKKEKKKEEAQKFSYLLNLKGKTKIKNKTKNGHNGQQKGLKLCR